jgi:hypothetical protein
MEFRLRSFLENIGAVAAAKKIEDTTGIKVYSAAKNLGSGQFYQELGAGIGEPLNRGVVQPVDSAIGSATQSIQDASGGKLLIGNAYQNSKEMVTSTEGQGFIKVVQGAMEVQAGMAMMGTGIGSVAGAVLIGHGIDTMQAGVRQARSGQQVRTGTAEAATKVTGSETCGDVADAALPLGASIVGAVAMASRRAALAAAAKAGNCFPAGTLVATESGHKPIQDVRAAERVWAFDLVANHWKLRHVIGTYQHEHEGNMVVVSVAGEEIQSTGHHPWWVIRGEGLSQRPQPDHVPVNPIGFHGEGRWVDAIDMRVGDVLLLRSGEQAAITSLEVRQARLPVYNFHVEELQCYAVGYTQILVHNNSVAETIAAGHAYEKHIVQGMEFPGVHTRGEFVEVIGDAIYRAEKSGDVRHLARGRVAWYDRTTNMVVIHNPASPDASTAFRPLNGVKYFENLE